MRTLYVIILLFATLSCFSQGLLINSGQFRINAGHVVIVNNGGWTNNGTANCVTGSTVDMAGNAIQNILGASTTAFSNLNINSTSSVFVGRDITINDNLQLTLGYFDLRAAITYLGNTSGNITGSETETKRIRATTNAGGTDDGVGIGTIQTTRTNPNGNVANLGLDFNGLTLGSTTIIRGHKQQTGTGSPVNYSVFRYYDIQPTVQSNVTVNSFNYFHAELGTQAANEANLEMFQWVQIGSPQWWMPRASVANTGPNNVSSTTTTNTLLTYKITLGSTNLPLPIELLSFKAECNNGQNNLLWQTASEQNNDFFTLEKSFDGINFNILTNVSSLGSNSNIMQNYSDIDFTPFNGTNYYRLKQTDLDGQFTYSDVISLNCNAINANEDILPISPSNGSVYALLQGIPGNKYQIKLTNLLGQVITNKEIILNDYQQSINIYNSNLATGMYYVILQTEKKNISKQIVISFN